METFDLNPKELPHPKSPLNMQVVEPIIHVESTQALFPTVNGEQPRFLSGVKATVSIQMYFLS